MLYEDRGSGEVDVVDSAGGDAVIRQKVTVLRHELMALHRVSHLIDVLSLQTKRMWWIRNQDEMLLRVLNGLNRGCGS